MPFNDEIISRSDERLSGRLIALPSSKKILSENLDAVEALSKATTIDFPAMPDSLELARQTDYAISAPNIVLPDGIHQYRGTRPMSVPFSFKLHAMDRTYCPQGALTLIKIAGRLHSMVLPVSSRPNQVTLISPPVTSAKTGQSDTGKQEHDADSNEDSYLVTEGTTLSPPVTCWLHLMHIATDQPGISCQGYVSQVSAKFNGPWMRGNKSEFNLPSSCDFSFTFMHVPSHSNNFEFVSSALKPVRDDTAQAYAHTVRDRFFNTRNLIAGPANYRGFD